jgi:hypothetical protein
MVLRDAAGLVVDSLNYGGLVDPWAAEGYQGTSPGNGCSAPSPGFGRSPGGRGPAGNAPLRSAGRFPDGADTGNNCLDFHLQATTTLAADSAVGAHNIKVTSVDFGVGQTITVDAGANRETAVIATVGTAGASTVRTDTASGATVIPVVSVVGFSPGQIITIDSATNLETAVVAAVAGGRRGGFSGVPGGGTITVAAPLTYAHGAGAPVSGSGLTLTSALTRAHESGGQILGNEPTPGAPNQYFK